MNKDQAKEILRKLAKHGHIITCNHCRTQMRERNVTTEDILYVLMWGKIKNIERDTKHINWKCEVEGKDLNDDILTVQVGVSENERAIMITVY